MVASKIRLSYFGIHGTVECSRVLLADSGVEHEDYIIDHEQWPSKEKTNAQKYPMGFAPVLEYDDALIPESGAIFRFLAAELNYVPQNNLQDAYANGICTMLDDINAKGYRPARDDKEKPEALKTWFEEGSKGVLEKFEAWVNRISNGKTFIAGTDQITYADIKFYDLFHWYNSIYSKVLEPYPRLKSVYEAIGARQNIKTYFETKRTSRRGGPAVAKIL